MFTTDSIFNHVVSVIYMSRNSRVFTTNVKLIIQFILIYMSRNSRVFTTFENKLTN